MAKLEGKTPRTKLQKNAATRKRAKSGNTGGKKDEYFYTDLKPGQRSRVFGIVSSPNIIMWHDYCYNISNNTLCFLLKKSKFELKISERSPIISHNNTISSLKFNIIVGNKTPKSSRLFRIKHAAEPVPQSSKLVPKASEPVPQFFRTSSNSPQNRFHWPQNQFHKSSAPVPQFSEPVPPVLRTGSTVLRTGSTTVLKTGSTTVLKTRYSPEGEDTWQLYMISAMSFFSGSFAWNR